MTFQTAISGLQAASTDLAVIGNNVANAATTGFKRSRAQFQDVFAVSSTGAAANSPGKGVDVSTVAQQFTQGNISFTDNPLDVAISGQGFLVLDNGGTQVYSRDGALGLDANNYVVNADGFRLQAFGADAFGNITGAIGDLQFNEANSAPEPTTQVNLGANFDADAEVPSVAVFDPNDPNSYNETTALSIYDSQGGSHLMQMYFVRDAAVNTWQMYSYVDGTEVNAPGTPDTLEFDGAGALTTPATGSFTIPTFTPEPGVNALDITVSVSNSTMYGANYSVNELEQDGYTTGRLTSIDFSDDGTIVARYSNGQSNIQGQIALAGFTNEQGLRPIGQNSWVESFETGPPILGRPGSGALGLIQGGALEDANVDLSQELVALIIAQRNFQANAEVITTADTVTQSIINIR